MNPSSLAAAGLALLMSGAPARAQIVNGSLTGPITNGSVPPGWSIVSLTPDTMDPDDNVGVFHLHSFGAAPSYSPDGGTWVGMAVGRSFSESFGQTMFGLVIGQIYTVSWYGSNFGYTDAGFTSANSLEMLIDGISAGHGDLMALAPGWHAQSLNFTAAHASEQIAFQAFSGDQAYIGIDGISIALDLDGPPAENESVVPEPASLLLLATGLFGIGVIFRRRRCV